MKDIGYNSQFNTPVELTILMPCLNEAKTLKFCIDEAKRFVTECNVNGEILIADNGSSDGSADIAKDAGARVVTETRQGYGMALIAGIQAAKGTYIIMGDCDKSYDFYHIKEFLDKLREGNDLVVGDRFSGNIEKGAMPFIHRLGVPFLSWLGRCKYKTKIRDFHCGLRGFNREKALELNLRCQGMEFATEIIGQFAKSNARICQVPINLRRDGRAGKSHLHTFRDGMRHLIYILFKS